MGKRRTPIEDHRFVMGQGQFVADIDLPNMRHVALVQSPYPAAKIVHIDRTEALSMPGVDCVMTGEELNAHLAPLGHGVDVCV